jgi:hypothetical protein
MRWRGDVLDAGIMSVETSSNHVSELTVILPFLGDLAQFRYAVELSIKVQYVLAVEALAGFYEVEIVFLVFPEFDDMVLGALELQCISVSLLDFVGETHNLMLLPKGCVDFEVGCPKFLFDIVGRGIFEVGD